MKTGFPITAIAIFFTLAASTAEAQSRRLLETTDEARQRHSAERWQEYERRGYQAPLGGYRERLGDPAPAGTESPGYTSPQGYGSGGYGYGQQVPGTRSRRW